VFVAVSARVGKFSVRWMEAGRRRSASCGADWIGRGRDLAVHQLAIAFAACPAACEPSRPAGRPPGDELGRPAPTVVCMNCIQSPNARARGGKGIDWAAEKGHVAACSLRTTSAVCPSRSREAALRAMHCVRVSLSPRHVYTQQQLAELQHHYPLIAC
jgi:hypothetical protein